MTVIQFGEKKIVYLDSKLFVVIFPFDPIWKIDKVTFLVYCKYIVIFEFSYKQWKNHYKLLQTNVKTMLQLDLKYLKNWQSYVNLL